MPAGGAMLIAAAGAGVAAGEPVVLSISGMPHHSPVPRYVALVLAAAIVLVGAWVAFKGTPASSDGRDAETKKLTARRGQLLGELARLESDHRVGKVDAAQFAARRERLITSLEGVYGALDRELRDRLMLDVRAILRDAGMTVVHVTHDHDEAFALGDRVAVLHDGRVEQVGPSDEVWRRPATARVARFLGATNGIDGTARSDGTIDTGLGPITGAGTGAGTVQILWRPEALRIDPTGPWRGTVVSTTFRRAHHLVTLDTPAGRIDAVADTAPEVGTEVRLTLDVDAVSVFPR